MVKKRKLTRIFQGLRDLKSVRHPHDVCPDHCAVAGGGSSGEGREVSGVNPKISNFDSTDSSVFI